MRKHRPERRTVTHLLLYCSARAQLVFVSRPRTEYRPESGAGRGDTDRGTGGWDGRAGRAGTGPASDGM